MDSDTSVKVAVRIRPLLEHELSQQCSICVNVVPDAPQVCQLLPAAAPLRVEHTPHLLCCCLQIVVGSDQNFTFDYVYGIHRRQEEVMEECVMPLVDGTLRDYTTNCFAHFP